LYLDASALVKRYVEEPGSGTVRRLLGSAAVATSRLSEVEVASALVRRCREGTLARHARDRALAALRADIAAIWVIEFGPEVAQTSAALLARHPLRPGDGIQLASCLYLKRQVMEDVSFLAYDARLNEAARIEGLPLLGLA
jgi:predicted nucleic acid-binding protein